MNRDSLDHRVTRMRADLWCECSADGVLEHVSPPLCQLLGVALEDVRHKPYEALLDAADVDMAKTAREVVMRDQRPVCFETRLNSNHTAPRWIEWCATYVNGDEPRLHLHARDVSHRYRAIAEAAAQQARLDAVLRTAVDGIVLINQHGCIQTVNPATERIFGYGAEELIGRNVSCLMPRPYRDEHDGYLANYLNTQIAKIIGIGREVVGQRRDGTVFPMDLAVSEVSLGTETWFAGVVRDITERKANELALRELNEQLEERVEQRTSELRQLQRTLVEKERFATMGRVSGGIAHEIRNPLNAIKTSVYYLLNANIPSADKIREHLERIDRQVDVANNVVTALAEFAKLPHPKQTTVSVMDAWREVLRDTPVPATIKLTLDLTPEADLVTFDRQQLMIAFRNLLRNACDAVMRDGGEIKVSCVRTDDEIRISVADSGVGIPPEQLETIFEPLYSTKARGIGLGLPITRAIVEKNQGRLDVSSQPGKGSEFSITLSNSRKRDP